MIRSKKCITSITLLSAWHRLLEWISELGATLQVLLG